MIPLPLPHQHKRDRGDRYCPATPAFYTSDQMLSYGEACRKDERERCAKLCELLSIDTRNDHWDAITADQCAYSIRSCTP